MGAVMSGGEVEEARRAKTTIVFRNKEGKQVGLDNRDIGQWPNRDNPSKFEDQTLGEKTYEYCGFQDGAAVYKEK
jgi:hypothetical protein